MSQGLVARHINCKPFTAAKYSAADNVSAHGKGTSTCAAQPTWAVGCCCLLRLLHHHHARSLRGVAGYGDHGAGWDHGASGSRGDEAGYGGYLRHCCRCCSCWGDAYSISDVMLDQGDQYV
jgi:hypothetical protein